LYIRFGAIWMFVLVRFGCSFWCSWMFVWGLLYVRL
jgi:hypothetical protein